MYCPEHLVFKSFRGRLYVWLIYSDVPRKTIPLKVWLDIRRYEVSIRVFGRTIIINKYGINQRKFNG